MRIHTLVIAAAMAFGLPSFTLPALAHDGVAIVAPYARTTGGAGSNGAVYSRHHGLLLGANTGFTAPSGVKHGRQYMAAKQEGLK